MDIANINYSKKCSEPAIKLIKKYSEQWCNKKNIDYADGSLFFCDDLELLNNISSKYNLYILAQSPKKSFSKLNNLQKKDGEHIFTIIGESKVIYSSKFSQMISKFLFEQAYLTKIQSKKYFTAFQECLVNAIEHGNLSLSNKKEEHLHPEMWFTKQHHLTKEDIQNNLHSNKLVIIECYLQNSSIVTYITDEGNGFDIEKNNDNKVEYFKAHGRGIALIEGITDKLTYYNGGKSVKFSFNAEFLSKNNFSQKNLDRENSKILIVDDQKSNLEIADFYLKSAGYKQIYLEESADKAIKKAIEIVPDIIIMDIIMPEIDGFTACRRIKQIDKLSNIPILFFSNLDDPNSKIKGYRLGAVDYVTKPIQRNELIARTDTHIKHSLLVKSLNNYIEKIDKDLEKAKNAQIELLPNKDDIEILKHKYDIEISSNFNICDKLAGDYWTIEDLGDGNIGIILADFTGHGVAASLNTVRLHALIKECYAFLNNPKEFIMHINEKLKHLIPLEEFATFVYGVFNTITGEFNYIGCGNPPIAIIPSNKDEKCYYLDCEGLPLGLVHNNNLNLELKKFKLNKGDSMFLFSDALLESEHKKINSMWGEKILLEKLNTIQEICTFPALEDIMDSFNHSAKKPLKDDLTMVWLTFKYNQTSKKLLHNYMNLDLLQQELSD